MENENRGAIDGFAQLFRVSIRQLIPVDLRVRLEVGAAALHLVTRQLENSGGGNGFAHRLVVARFIVNIFLATLAT